MTFTSGATRPTSTDADVLDVVCPKCSAPAGTPCKRQHHTRAGSPHAWRRERHKTQREAQPAIAHDEHIRQVRAALSALHAAEHHDRIGNLFRVAAPRPGEHAGFMQRVRELVDEVALRR